MNPQSLETLEQSEIDSIIERDSGIDEIQSDVQSIVDTVQADGDEALREFSSRFDGVDLETLDILAQTEAAVERISDDLRETIETAIDNVRAFHERQVRDDWRDSFDGMTLGRQFRPIDRIGAYVPGGTATYPSTAIMTIVPAKVAGVEDVVIVTPPAEELNPVTLAAIELAGADEVYSIGGAQAIAALAYGTETIAPVRKIVGPGNRWVAAAKAAVRGDVAIDMIAGPTEVLVVADDSADPELVATELVAQAEHDLHSSTVAVTTSDSLAESVAEAVERQIPERDRSDIIRQALDNDSSGIFVADSMAAATEFADAYAVEHLVLMTEDDDAALERIDSAGSVFIGDYSPVAGGDYASGPNHVLPTAKNAQTTGGLSVDSFVRSRTIQHLDESSLESIADTVTTLAELEGLEAHAQSVRDRFE